MMMRLLDRSKKAFRKYRLSGLAAGLTLMFTGCGPDERILSSGEPKPNASNIERKLPSIEEDIEAMRTADFDHIYVLRRKDGGEMDAEDKGVIRVNTDGANRRVASSDGSAFLIGTNTKLPPKNMMALYERFAVENYSKKPAGEIETNSGRVK